MNAAAIKKMTVVQLKKKCTELKLPKNGRKADLVKRLIAHAASKTKEPEAPAAPKPTPAKEPEPKKTEIVSASTKPAPPTKALAGMTDEERAAARRARFGTSSVQSNLESRKNRFGTGVTKAK